MHMMKESLSSTEEAEYLLKHDLINARYLIGAPPMVARTEIVLEANKP